jgi:hypothetical protein
MQHEHCPLAPKCALKINSVQIAATRSDGHGKVVSILILSPSPTAKYRVPRRAPSAAVIPQYAHMVAGSVFRGARLASQQFLNRTRFTMGREGIGLFSTNSLTLPADGASPTAASRPRSSGVHEL